MLSLIRDIFQKSRSKSIIVPVYKKGDADSPGSYRGVSLLSVVSEICTYIFEQEAYTMKMETNC